MHLCRHELKRVKFFLGADVFYEFNHDAFSVKIAPLFRIIKQKDFEQRLSIFLDRRSHADARRTENRKASSVNAVHAHREDARQRQRGPQRHIDRWETDRTTQLVAMRDFARNAIRTTENRSGSHRVTVQQRLPHE